MTHLKDNKDNKESDIPGYLQGSLLNILDFDADMLSVYGLKVALVLKQIQQEDEAKLKAEAKKLDDMLGN